MKYYNGLVICSDGSVAVVNFTAAPRLQIRLNKKARQILKEATILKHRQTFVRERGSLKSKSSLILYALSTFAFLCQKNPLTWSDIYPWTF